MMLGLFGWPFGSDKVPETEQQRELLRQQLGITAYLAKREILTVEQGKVHCELYVHSETAPIIIFLPGLATYSELYAELLSKISEQGFNVVGFDYRGHGYSQGLRGDYSVEETVNDLIAVVTKLRERFSGELGVFGYSIGAMLGLAFAERDTRVKALLCGTLLLTEVPPDFMHQMGWNWLWSSSLFVPALRVPLAHLINIELLIGNHPAAEAIKNDQRLVYDYPISTLSSVFTHRAGVLEHAYPFKAAIIHGERDEVLPLSYSKRILPQLKHPFELLVIANEGHMLPWDNTNLLAQQVVEWFDKQLHH
ncbi:alpha/beta hydrolase [Thiolinea disciformis]|uniref:alpha/beta hydrolase n=1 Tax=Thiolinea disciformis TaxID=125614 RepID=UPI001B7FA600|nr:alpha/beta fold hydrolase [Thiolinea disciformis]